MRPYYGGVVTFTQGHNTQPNLAEEVRLFDLDLVCLDQLEGGQEEAQKPPARVRR